MIRKKKRFRNKLFFILTIVGGIFLISISEISKSLEEIYFSRFCEGYKEGFLAGSKDGFIDGYTIGRASVKK